MSRENEIDAVGFVGKIKYPTGEYDFGKITVVFAVDLRDGKVKPVEFIFDATTKEGGGITYQADKETRKYFLDKIYKKEPVFPLPVPSE